MVPPVRHQEHLYNVNVMEMSSHKEPLKWLLFIGWQFGGFMDNTSHNKKTLSIIIPPSLYMSWVFDHLGVRPPYGDGLWGWYWVITIITRGLHQLASALSEAGPSHAWRDIVTQPRDSHAAHICTPDGCHATHLTWGGNVFMMETWLRQMHKRNNRGDHRKYYKLWEGRY